jgi:hypothetical protein
MYADWRKNWRVGVVTLTLFGACALTFLATIRRKQRATRREMTTVSVVGGVNINAQGGQLAPIAIGCIAVGTVLCFIDVDTPLYIRILGAFVAVVGIVLLALILLRVLSRRFLRFEPEALIIGEPTYQLRIEWDDVADVFELEYADNPFVALCVAGLDRVEVTPASRRDRAMRACMNNQMWKADIVL